MINKPDDHIEFIMESLSKVSSSLVLTKTIILLQYKDSKQPTIKWDAFVGPKGVKNNKLAPIKPTNTNSSSSFLTELNHQSKLNPISQGMPRPSSPTTDQNAKKNLLNGKPIIFVGGGPGIKMIYLIKKKPLSLFYRQW